MHTDSYNDDMNAETATRLLDLNRQFYQTFGPDFSDTRGRIQPGVRFILETLKGNESILDLGCGNGSLARELRRGGHRGAYTGLDFSPPLLEKAQQDMRDDYYFLQVDLAAWEHRQWATDEADPVLRPSSFDLITAFAVLHHIPGQELRLEILQKVHELLKPGGSFIHSEWQFLNSEKLKRRIQAWENAGLAPEDVDANDFLLDWRGGGHGLRYVHHFDETELAALAAAGRFRIWQTFHSDGENGRLGLYQIWESL